VADGFGGVATNDDDDEEIVAESPAAD